MMKEIIVGSLVVIVLLVLGSFFAGKYAKEDTEKAVHSVSLFYLDELAQRREQVIETALKDFVSNLDIVTGLISPHDLTSVQSLQEYLARMKQLYNVERLAFVDEPALFTHQEALGAI